MNYLPEEADSYGNGEYRWSPKTDPEITQIGYVASGSGSEWSVLDSVTLKGAASLTAAASASIAFALSF